MQGVLLQIDGEKSQNKASPVFHLSTQMALAVLFGHCSPISPKTSAAEDTSS
jgi:hypothetical protein